MSVFPSTIIFNWHTTRKLGVFCEFKISIQWRHNGLDGVSNHQPHHCLLNRLFRRRSKKTSKLHASGLCAGNSPVIGEFPVHMASNAENVYISWRHHTGLQNYVQFSHCLQPCNHESVIRHDNIDHYHASLPILGSLPCERIRRCALLGLLRLCKFNCTFHEMTVREPYHQKCFIARWKFH